MKKIVMVMTYVYNNQVHIVKQKHTTNLYNKE